ncbi:MAG: hypothetical protein JEZ08_25185 [Clostridiales bacterium]|nr:hypothetical protein [Clostridiales bacterium]
MKSNRKEQSASLYKILNNNQGATSVLIIMLLVVLMIFSLTILTTTLSNESLSDKKNEWLIDYYELESKVALSLAEIDHSIQNIKEETLVQSATSEKSSFMIELLEENLDGFMKEEGRYYFWVDVTEDSGDYLKYITVKAEIIIPENELNDKEYLTLENYRIVIYSESQDLFDYEDIEFGNPFAPGDN